MFSSPTPGGRACQLCRLCRSAKPSLSSGLGDSGRQGRHRRGQWTGGKPPFRVVSRPGPTPRREQGTAMTVCPPSATRVLLTLPECFLLGLLAVPLQADPRSVPAECVVPTPAGVPSDPPPPVV